MTVREVIDAIVNEGRDLTEEEPAGAMRNFLET